MLPLGSTLPIRATPAFTTEHTSVLATCLPSRLLPPRKLQAIPRQISPLSTSQPSSRCQEFWTAHTCYKGTAKSPPRQLLRCFDLAPGVRKTSSSIVPSLSLSTASERAYCQTQLLVLASLMRFSRFPCSLAVDGLQLNGGL